MPLGITYVICGGLGIVMTAIIVAVLFRQMLDLPVLLGIGLIVSAVVVMNTLSKTVGTEP